MAYIGVDAMQRDLLKEKSRVKIGVKQVTRSLKTDNALTLFIAKDAEKYVVRQILFLAEKNNVEIIFVDTMKELGSFCNIDVGAATAVIEK